MEKRTSLVAHSLKRTPGLSPRAVHPLLIGIVLLVVSSVTFQLRIDYLVQNSYSRNAFLLANSTFSPVWEESLKVGLGVVVGYVIAALFVLVERIGGRGSADARPDTRLSSRQILRWASSAVFLITALVFAVTEGLMDWNVLKVLGHPGFSILALQVVLEAKPRAVWFVGLGFGFHSLVNLILGTLTERVELIAYMLATLFIVVVDLRLFLFWYPPPWRKGEGPSAE